MLPCKWVERKTEYHSSATWKCKEDDILSASVKAVTTAKRHSNNAPHTRPCAAALTPGF